MEFTKKDFLRYSQSLGESVFFMDYTAKNELQKRKQNYTIYFFDATTKIKLGKDKPGIHSVVYNKSGFIKDEFISHLDLVKIENKNLCLTNAKK